MGKRSDQGTSSALDILRSQIAGDFDAQVALEVERLNAEIASMIYEARVKHGLRQADLAKMIGTSQSAVARIEDADYTGHSLRVLAKIAVALGARLRAPEFVVPDSSVDDEETTTTVWHEVGACTSGEPYVFVYSGSEADRDATEVDGALEAPTGSGVIDSRSDPDGFTSLRLVA